jgi:GntR family transcriptional regulator
MCAADSDDHVSAPDGSGADLGGDLCVRTNYEVLAEGKPAHFSTSWEPHSLTGGTLIVLPEGGPYAGWGVVERMAIIGVHIIHAVEQSGPGEVTTEEAQLVCIQRVLSRGP